MEFRETATDENYSMMKLLSTGGRWELGLKPVLHGVRVRAGIAGDQACAIDLCAGADAGHIDALLGMTVVFLSAFPESATAGEICRAMPTYSVKPVFNDGPFMRKFASICTATAAARGKTKGHAPVAQKP